MGCLAGLKELWLPRSYVGAGRKELRPRAGSERRRPGSLVTSPGSSASWLFKRSTSSPALPARMLLARLR